MKKVTLGLSILIVLWLLVPIGLFFVVYYLDRSPIQANLAAGAALVGPFLITVVSIRPSYRSAVVHALGAFTLSALAYVWLTLGSFSEFSAMLLLESFLPVLVVATALVYMVHFTASLRRTTV